MKYQRLLKLYKCYVYWDRNSDDNIDIYVRNPIILYGVSYKCKLLDSVDEVIEEGCKYAYEEFKKADAKCFVKSLTPNRLLTKLEIKLLKRYL